MPQRARIEVQNHQGEWRYYTSVPVQGASVKLGIEAALRSPLGRISGKARAIDDATGAVIDTPLQTPRAGWEEQAARFGPTKLFDAPTPTQFDDEEWEW